MKDEAEMRYLDSALREELGGEHAPDLAERILASASRAQAPMPARGRTGKLGRRAPLPIPVRRRSPLGAIVAAFLLFVAASAVLVGLNFAGKTLDHKDSTETGKGTLPNIAPRANVEQAPRSEKPANTPPANTAEPVEPAPEKQPENPTKPDEVRKPDVRPEEKPVTPEQPKNQDGTEVKKPDLPKPEEKPVVPPATPATLAVVKDLSRKNALKLRYADTEAWRAAESGEALREGAQLSVSGHADVQLATGALLRFNGEITLGAEISLISEDLYVDNLDCAELKLSSGENKAGVNGIAMFAASRGSLSISCVQGSVSTSDGAVSAGKTATLTQKGLGKPQPTNMETLARKHSMLRVVPQRVLLREDFDAASKDRLDKGELANGVAQSEGKEAGVSIYFPATFKLRAGDVVRLRYRVSRALEELVLQFGTEEKGNYRDLLVAPKLNEWVEVEIPLAELVRTLDKTTKIETGLSMKYFQLWAVAPAAVKLEVEWFEIIRRPVDG